MPDEIIFRPLLPQDLDHLVAFQTTLHPILVGEPEKSSAYYHWKYFAHPNEPSLPVCWGAFQQDRLCALLGTLPFLFDPGNGTTTPCGWICDWYVAPSYRGQGLGRRLLQEAEKAFPALACVNGSDEATALYESSGFRHHHCGHDMRWLIQPFHYEWHRRRGLRRLEALVKTPLFGKRGASTSKSESHWQLSTAASITNRSAIRIGMRRTPAVLQWLAKNPVAQVDFWRHPNHQAIVAIDDDWRGFKRVRVLDLDPPDAEHGAWQELIAELATHYRPVYIDAIVPSSYPQGDDCFPTRRGKERTVWFKGEGAASIKMENWKIGLMDKDNAFRYGKHVP